MQMIAEVTARADLEWATSDQAPPGVRVVATASGALYFLDNSDPDRDPRVTRYPGPAAGALNDGQPLPGVHAYTFDVRTRIGEIFWWKDDPAQYDNPTLPYIGTVRATSRVLLIARLRNPDPAELPSTLALIRECLNALSDPRLNSAIVIEQHDRHNEQPPISHTRLTRRLGEPPTQTPANREENADEQ
ncbi:hypothetical protein G3N18_14435 [Microbacterium sp. 2C]|uniref:hypothetical protein n=1 Tax=Microbacterium paulum TaxID=2707006 RepID=UPI0018C29BE9|nr:hypothetical protein [Microbacterium paulum]MBG0719237.1 hypothetical protein [Microbacterium paulum]